MEVLEGRLGRGMLPRPSNPGVGGGDTQGKLG